MSNIFRRLLNGIYEIVPENSIGKKGRIRDKQIGPIDQVPIEFLYWKFQTTPTIFGYWYGKIIVKTAFCPKLYHPIDALSLRVRVRQYHPIDALSLRVRVRQSRRVVAGNRHSHLSTNINKVNTLH